MEKHGRTLQRQWGKIRRLWLFQFFKSSATWSLNLTLPSAKKRSPERRASYSRPRTWIRRRSTSMCRHVSACVPMFLAIRLLLQNLCRILELSHKNLFAWFPKTCITETTSLHRNSFQNVWGVLIPSLLSSKSWCLWSTARKKAEIRPWWCHAPWKPSPNCYIPGGGPWRTFNQCDRPDPL